VVVGAVVVDTYLAIQPVVVVVVPEVIEALFLVSYLVVVLVRNQR
jgi:hypothetical protein